MPDRRLIDSHQHVFWHGRDDAGLIADMDEYNIEKAWLLTWLGGGDPAAFDPRRKEPGAPERAIPLHSVIEACRRYPERFIPGYCPDPLDPHAVAKLKAAVAIHGVRVCGEWGFELPFEDPRCLELYRCAGQLGLPVVLHLDVAFLPPKGGRYVGAGQWYGGTIENLERALIACPETIFVGHAPGFWRELHGEADTWPEAYLKPPLPSGGRLWGLFERNPNLYADLSAGSALRALRADPAEARRLLLQFADRILFGRDYYGGDMLAFLAELDLPEPVWRKIGRENAEGLLAPTSTPSPHPNNSARPRPAAATKTPSAPAPTGPVQVS